MTLVLIAMIGALLIPMIEALRDDDIWQRMLAFASIATKSSVMILVIALLQDDRMMALVGVIILSVGNAALMLLAQIIRRVNDVMEG
jgi:multicomponent Na+:H+ antiporter subunit F